jgi:TolB-like protein
MEEHAGADVVRFSGFRFDRSHGCLLRQDKDGTFTPVAVRSRALDLLGLLIDRHGDLVSKDEILNAVWPGVVEGANVTVQISALRRVLDEGRSNGSLIQTVAGRGYRFVAPVARDEPAARRTISLPSNSPRMSIVVLPFANLGGDREQQYFADALTDDLATDLSRIADMLVISRNTAFTYRDKPADTRQIGRELRVRYALEGSVRRLGNHIRVNAQLVDAETDTHLWAERFDRDVGDLFALQDEVTSRIAIALKTELVTAEAARPTEHPDALDYLFRARAVLLQPWTRDHLAAAIGLFERALALDPSSVEAQSRLANALVNRVINDMTASQAADMARAEKLISEALAVSPRSALAHFVKGQVLRAQRRPEEAIPEYETVVALDRNWLWAYANVSWCKLLIGSIDEVIPLVERLFRLSPRDREVGVWNYWIGRVHLLKSRTDEAILWFEKARRTNPALAFIHAYLASAYALNGEAERAAAELAEARRLSADGRYSGIKRLRATQYFGVPKVRDLFEATYFAG